MYQRLTPDRRRRFWLKVQVGLPDECWPFVGARSHGRYGSFGLGDGIIATASRVAWTLAHEQDIPEGQWVLHSCDNPSCCNPAHLRLGDRDENMADMVRRRRHWAHQGRDCSSKGERHGMAKIDAEAVLAIRAKYVFRKVTAGQLADEFGISREMVGRIVRRENWTHI